MDKSTLFQEFSTIFGYAADGAVKSPGRVNIIGEHTDYNEGFVFPCALNFATTTVYKKRGDKTVRVRSLNFKDAEVSFELNKDIKSAKPAWSNYVRGVALTMLKQGLELDGADLLIYGDVPLGSGLSSSAALELSVGGAFNEISNLGLHKTTMALIGQQAENEFLGCQCGIMDQMISAHGEEDHALLIDCRDLNIESVPLPRDIAIIIINSNYKRQLVGSEYNLRREQCEQAAEIMQVKMLRDATVELLEKHKSEMSDVIYRRARHVITENHRTLEVVDALKAKDMSKVYENMAASHDSMRDDFEITVPEIDSLVQTAQEALGDQGGARMTGGGFGGAIVALCPPAMAQSVIAKVEAQYQKEFGIKASSHICSASDGLHKL